MSGFLVLDSGPLGAACAPRPQRDFAEWLAGALASDFTLVVPEICDYEVRRELIRGGRDLALARLNRLGSALRYEEVTTSTLRLAAQLWAEARASGRPTADPHSLDADVILAATTRLLSGAADEAIVVSDNVGHLGRFVRAEHWSAIRITR